MAARFGSYLCTIALLLICATSKADDAADPAQQDEMLRLLKGHQFAELDHRYGAIQQAYKDHRISDVDLRAAFRAFYPTDPALAPHYQAWVRESPKSYVAHLARGIYYKKVAEERRGGAFISETSQKQLDGMEDAFAISDSELSASLALDNKPLLTYMYAIDHLAYEGDKAGARHRLDAAVAIDPWNFVVRAKYMSFLETRWLGSVAEMQDFLRECRAAGLAGEHLKQLQAMVIMDEAWVHQYRDGDINAAVSDYRRAAKLDPDSACVPCGPLLQAADALRDKKSYAEAIKLYSEVLESEPKSIAALQGRASSELQLMQMPAAVADLQRGAELNDAWSQYYLGNMYRLPEYGGDMDKVTMWLKRAADQNFEPAKQELAQIQASRRNVPASGSVRP